VLSLRVLSAPVLASRGPRVSCGAALSVVVSLTPPVLVVLVSVVLGCPWLAVLSMPTLSAVTVAVPVRPLTPGGPVRVESITWVTAVLSPPLSGAAPTSSCDRLWQAANEAVAAARISRFLIRSIAPGVMIASEAPRSRAEPIVNRQATPVIPGPP